MSRKVAIASLIWGASMLLSRVIGLVREAVIGRVLGGGREADVYLTSFVIPDFLNYLLAGGALTIIFIPIFGGYLARDEEAKGWESFSYISNAMAVILGAVVGLAWLAVPWLVPLVAPGFDAAQSVELVFLTRILLPAQMFHLMGGLLSAALQARDRHTLPALAPLVYTLGVIGGGLLGAWMGLGAEGFAWGVVVGSFLGPFLLPLVGCVREGMRWSPVLRFSHPDLATYLKRTAPLLFCWSIVVADDWFLRRLGSTLGEGAITTVQYAKTLMRVPMGVFGVATGLAAYPTLTRLLASGERAEAYTLLATSTRRMLVLAFASQVALSAAGAEISRVIYGGRIPDSQHAAIGLSVGLVSLGLWGWAAQTVVARGFWAMGRIWGPTLLGAGITVASYPLYAALSARWGTSGLAVASSVAISTYVVALILWLRRSFPGVPDRYGAFFGRVLPSVAVGLGVGLGLREVLPDWPALLRGGLLAVAAMGAFFGAALLLRVPDIDEVLGALTRRLRRRRPA